MTAIISQDETKPTQARGLVWTLDRYHHAIEAGVFTEDDRIELLDGKIVEKMSVGTKHSACLKILNKYFNRRYLDIYELMSENPVSLGDKNEPEPDFTILHLREDNYIESHPSPKDILLIIEVADESLSRDRTRKASLYAQANISEYWIINLVNRQIEVHTKPSMENGVFGSVQHFNDKEQFESPFAGDVLVKDLLP